MDRILRALVLALGTLVCANGAARAEPYDWTGLYIAAHFSGESSDFGGRFMQPNGGLTMPSGLSDVNGAAYGLAIGGNWQAGHMVLGFEARWSGASVSASEKVTFGSVTQTRKIEDLITIGPRLGVALSRFHVYGTIGFATSGYRAIATSASIMGGVNTTVSDVDERVYGTFGGVGVEWGITDTLFVGVEYDRVYLGGVEASWRDNGGELNLFKASDTTIDSLVARVGLKF